jgi:predicted HNH restriction endonuclease
MPSFYFLWNPEKRPDLSEELRNDARLLAAGKRPEVWNWSTGSRTRKHLVRERNQALVMKKKRAVLSTTGTLTCEVCRFDFLETYAELGRGFAECHHLTPLALLTETTETRLEDLAIVCANCHRMLHRGKPWKTIAQLKDILLASPKPRR